VKIAPSTLANIIQIISGGRVLTDRADLAIWGAPGTGKTTRLLELIEEKIEDEGLNLHDICVSTFRKPLAEECKTKIADKMGISAVPDDTYIGTTHSICYQLLDEEDYDHPVAGEEHRKDFCEKFGVNYEPEEEKSMADLEEVMYFEGGELGNTLFSLNSYRRNNPSSSWTDGPVNEEDLSDINDYLLDEFSGAWEEYKEEEDLIDFDDMLSIVLENGLYPWVDVLFEDEFQDKTPLQYEVYRMWTEKIPEVIIAGDPLQSIYTFLGTRADFFEEQYENAENREVRPKTYRFSKDLWSYARQIPEKEGLNTPNIEGSDERDTRVRFIDMNDFRRLVSDFRNESVLYLVRANFMKSGIGRILKDRGIPYVSDFNANSRITNLYNAIAYSRKNLSGVDSFVTTEVQLRGEYAYEALKCFPATEFDGVKKNLKEKARNSNWLNLPVTPSFVTRVFKDNPFEKMLSSASMDGKDRRLLNDLLHRRRGEPIDPGKQHIVSTIHGSKGREADLRFSVCR